MDWDATIQQLEAEQAQAAQATRDAQEQETQRQAQATQRYAALLRQEIEIAGTLKRVRAWAAQAGPTRVA